jgi:hypothetical protein
VFSATWCPLKQMAAEHTGAVGSLKSQPSAWAKIYMGFWTGCLPACVFLCAVNCTRLTGSPVCGD